MSNTHSGSNQLYLGRQPILDRNQHLVAYELLFRSSSLRNAAVVQDGSTATATVIANAFSELAIGDALGTCRGFINVEEDFLFSDMLELLPPQSVVLEIIENVRPTPAVVARCRELKAKGYSFALDDFVQFDPEFAEMLDVVDIVKVDILRLTTDELLNITQRLRPLNKKLLAEKVDSREQMQQCLELGYQLFQGYYFARPTIIAGKKLNPSQIALMKLLSLLISDADVSELEAAFKPEPVLTVNLLRMTNSAGAGTTVHITSLRHAITVLGQRQLQRWLQLLLFTSGRSGGNSNNPLLHLAATRGRMMELLATKQRKGDTSFADGAFMVGIMSLMPALLGLPIEDIVAPLGITEDVHDALCRSDGKLGKLLRLVAATESSGDAHAEVSACLAECPGLDEETLGNCLAQALSWASAIGREGEH